METLNDTEKKMLMQKYNKLFNAKWELHKLMRRVVVSTKLGRQRKQPDDDIELRIGNGTLGSCGKYGQVRYCPTDFAGEFELDNDLELIQYLTNEINTRFLQFQKGRDSDKMGCMKNKKKFAQQYFLKPLVEIEHKSDSIPQIRYGKIIMMAK